MKTRTSILSKNRQTGNAGGWILAILIFGGLMTVAATLVPVYLDHNTMSGLLDKMAEEPGLSNSGDTELRDLMKKRFKLNNIRDFDLEEHVDFERTKKGTEIVMDYEVRMKLIKNIDLIAAFDKKVLLRE